ncbi:cupin domain-containing protein [Brevundimonas sp. NPDC003935]|uniref:cupin domain-containing protein n=1 Tax=unclassified Brevundimonas TaxID=2622653 RepID=UPI0036BBEE0A
MARGDGDEGDNIIGPRLRALRDRLGLSQRALARKAGVPSSTVSLVESGRTSPSVGSLKRLLDAAGVSLGEFFSSEFETPTKHFYRHDELTDISRGEVSYRQLGSGQDSSLQILHETYQPGSDSGRVMLSHEGEEGGLIISGRLEVTVDGQSRVLKAGDGYLFPSTLPHRFRNVGDVPCVVISACTPPTF